MAVTSALIAAAAQILTSGKSTTKVQQPGQPAGAQPGGQAQDIFSSMQPQAKARPLEPVQANPNEGLATTLALLGDAPVGPPTPEQTTAPPNKTPTDATKKPQSIGDILSASSKALGDLAPLLGLMAGQGGGQRVVTGGAAGGPQGQLVQGFQLPQRRTLGEILASLPR